MTKALEQVAGRLAISPDELQNVILNTLMPKGNNVAQPTIEQFNAFIAVANEYGLNPLTKEIYAFPAKGGGIQPIVSIDGWLRIINTHPDFNGMTFKDERDEKGKFISITCLIHKKGIDHPVEVTEYFAECNKGTEPWQKWPSRMLRHKATIQAGRYAFGLSGIIDPDEAERYKEVGAIVDEKIVSTQTQRKTHTEEDFEKFHKYLESGSNIEFTGYCQQVDEEILTSLFNSFPDGKKTSGKKAVSEKQKAGFKELNGIKSQMLSDDPETKETALDGLNEIEKRVAVQFSQQ